MKFESITYRIGEQFLPALVNGDWSGLSDEEAEQFEAWFEAASAEWADFKGNKWVYAHESVSDNREEFAKCEVTGLMGNVCDVEFLFRSI